MYFLAYLSIFYLSKTLFLGNNNTKGFEGYPEGLTQSKNPYHFPYGMGNNGSDFTVGAVLLKSGMGNFFKGQIGGLAVFDRALTGRELKRLAE